VPTGETAKPKHRQLFEELGLAIQKGAFVPGQRLPTEAELMQQYGVSRTTVTRTLRDLEHHGVIRRRRGSGTFVKEVQRTATQQFGMLVHGIEPGSIFLKVYETLARAVDQAGAHVLLTHLNAQSNLADEAAESAERMIARGVRGVFFLPHGMFGAGESLNRRVTEIFARANVPVVLLDRDIVNFPQRSAYDLISVDNIRGGYLLGQHLVDVGCKRTLFFCENVAFSSARARWNGYRAAMEANGREAISFGGDPESAAMVLDAVRQHNPDGIACDNDRHAAMIMRHLLNAKIDIPGQIKLAGFDDTPTASLLTVPLTTVRQPAGAIALRALSVMNDRLAHPHDPPVHVAVHCDLVVRNSTVIQPDSSSQAFAADAREIHSRPASTGDGNGDSGNDVT
jgi:GntR family transcriptional regulator, arabinose operon transcriptional repressor